MYSTRKRLKTSNTNKKELKESLKKAFAQMHTDEETKRNLESILSDDILGKLAAAKLNRNNRFDSDIKEFAMSLHFYSPKVQSNMKNNSLSHVELCMIRCLKL